MKRSLRGGLALLATGALLVATAGCGRNNAASSPPTNQGGPQPIGVGPGGPPGAGGPGGPGGGGDSAIKHIMRTLERGPNSLRAINEELSANQPAWDAIQAQTAECAKLAADLCKTDPPRGSKESWSKLTTAYSASATELDKAASAKDVNAAKSAHGKLTSSCMECHREHRGGRGGFGGGRRGPGGP